MLQGGFHSASIRNLKAMETRADDCLCQLDCCSCSLLVPAQLKVSEMLMVLPNCTFIEKNIWDQLLILHFKISKATFTLLVWLLLLLKWRRSRSMLFLAK